MGNQILSVENLRLSFHGPDGRVPAVRDVSLRLEAGQTLALVGESGCGKTALCRAVMMLHSRHASVEGGRIILCGRDVTAMSEKELEKIRGRDAAMVFQDPMSSLNPTLSVGQQIMEPILLHGKLSRKEAKEKALDLLRLVEIGQPELRFGQYPHHFSGGMRQRVAIAIALAADPKLLIADEPTTALDMDTQGKIMELMRKLAADGERAVLFVTHDLGLAEDIADRTAVMKDGRIVEEGCTADIFAGPEHEYTRKLLSYARYGKGGSHYHGAFGKAIGKGGGQLPQNNGRKENSEDFCRGEAVAVIRGLEKHFALGRKKVNRVLDGFDLTVRRGEIVGIVGPSGCGKSTLARCIMGIYQPDAGEILLAEGCRKQMIFQDSASAFNPRMKLFDIIAEPLVIRRSCRSRAEMEEKVYSLMDQVGLERELAVRHPYDVSGGQRQRAAIARALITDPDLLIADEPIASLDVTIQSQIIHLLKQLHDERNLAVLLIAHDLPMAQHISDRIVEMGVART